MLSFPGPVPFPVLLGVETKLRTMGGEAASGSSDGRKTRREYQLLGDDIGAACLQSILAVGPKRFWNCINGIADMRFTAWGGGVRQSPKTSSVDKFLYELHGNVAETLPTESLECKKSRLLEMFC